MSDRSIRLIDSGKPGKTVAIFAGIHGNEMAGVMALKKVRRDLKLKSGRAYLIIANPPAIKEKTRFITKNLNRCFKPDNNGRTWEDKRARELMKILDQSDALLDLHGYNGPEDGPFVICDPLAFDIARKLDFDVITTGWTSLGAGATDSYMSNLNKPALCLECGSNDRPEDYSNLAERSIYQFLQHFDLVESTYPNVTKSRRYIRIKRMIIKQTDDLSFDRKYKNFDPLTEGKIFARDGLNEYKAGRNECIIFPRANQIIGHEFCIIGEFIEEL